MENPGLISPNLATFALTLVNIGILFLLLRAILFKPVSKFIAERAKKIEDTIAQAENDKNEAKELLAKYEARLTNADNEAAAIIKHARENAAQEAEKILLDGKKSAEIFVNNARKQIETEHDAALQNFRTEAAMLIIAASSKLIARDLRNDDNRHFINLMMEELAAKRQVRKRET